MIVQDIKPKIVLDNFKTDMQFIKRGILSFSKNDLNTLHTIGNYKTELKAAFILQHLIEHAQLHVGQIILICKLIKN